MTIVALLMPAVSPGSTSVTSTCPAARLRPALVHAQEHVRPIARFGAARPGVDAHDAVALVVAAAEKDLQFERIKLLEEPGEVLFQLLLDLGLGGFRLRLAQLDHDVEVFELLLRLEERFGLVAEGIGLVNELLGLLAVVPEVLRRHQGVDFAQAFLRARARQRNLRRWASLSVAVASSAVIVSNIP